VWLAAIQLMRGTAQDSRAEEALFQRFCGGSPSSSLDTVHEACRLRNRSAASLFNLETDRSRPPHGPNRDFAPRRRAYSHFFHLNARYGTTAAAIMATRAKL
jgi:hypothetical protein